MLLTEKFGFLMHLTWVTVLIRVALATLCGGSVGIERAYRGRPAGFRTHILVCLGASLTMMTNQFIFDTIGSTDPARFGAQVISGIGFLGAGTILVRKNNRVSGLTTAAGLWASACMGLAIGIGFYEGALLACAVILFTEHILLKADVKQKKFKKTVSFYVELSDVGQIGAMLTALYKTNLSLKRVERSIADPARGNPAAVILEFSQDSGEDPVQMLVAVCQSPGVLFAEEIS